MIRYTFEVYETNRYDIEADNIGDFVHLMNYLNAVGLSPPGMKMIDNRVRDKIFEDLSKTGKI